MSQKMFFEIALPIDNGRVDQTHISITAGMTLCANVTFSRHWNLILLAGLFYERAIGQRIRPYRLILML